MNKFPRKPSPSKTSSSIDRITCCKLYTCSLHHELLTSYAIEYDTNTTFTNTDTSTVIYNTSPTAEVPPQLRKLVRLVARAFFQPQHIVVLDILSMYPW